MLAQEEKIQLADIAIPLPVQDPFTYRLPVHLAEQLKVGCRVRVPFRNRTIVGYAVGVDSERHVEQAKDILEVLDPEPVISDHLLRLAKWISQYYFSSWGEAIASVIPKVFKTSVEGTFGVGSVFDRPDTIRLNQEQEKAFVRIKSCLNEGHFSELYIFGVTGGGKSELYIRAIKEVLKQGKSAICLVPEIALTEQLKLFFTRHFQETLEILHSRLSAKDRFEVWDRIRREEKRVILGARSAIFAPAPRLGLIIMDEEQESSYKQDQTPRYHAREVGRWRAQDLDALFMMGTATPTLETMYRASLGEVEMLTLSKRVEGKPMPEVKIVDLKQATEISKKSVIISSGLREAIEQALSVKNSVLLMLNRRGFSTHIHCVKCGEVLFCRHCAVALTFHQGESQALCHYCNFHLEVPKLCAKCGHPLLKFSGIGTEKVESEVARFFPKARVARLDRDSTRKRGTHEGILSRFRAREIDILVGTQMIAKGFDFQDVSLVGIINADTGLLLPDFRSAERTFQLLTQMAGRTGRGKNTGTVLIQTYSPNHYSIQLAAKHDYTGFFSEEISRRRELRYPPFTKIINLIFRGRREQEVSEQALQFRSLLKKQTEEPHLEWMGPAPLPFYRLRGQYRWHLMLRGTQMETMNARVRSALEEFKRKKGVHLAIDVEPVTIL